MLVAEYDAFVQATDQSAGKSEEDRWDIAIWRLMRSRKTFNRTKTEVRRVLRQC